MNRYIPVHKAVNYIIGILAIILIFSIWPLGLIHRNDVSKSDEIFSTESGVCNDEHIIAQVFVSRGTELKSVDIYVCSDVAGQSIKYSMYDGTLTEIYSKTMKVDEDQITPGFVHIPMRLEVERGAAYIASVTGVDCDLTVGLEDHDTTSNGDVFAITYDGMENPDHNIIIRYNYGIAFTWWQVILLVLVIIALAAGLTILSNIFLSQKTEGKTVKVQTLLCWSLNPIIIIATGIMMWLVFPKMLFSDKLINIIFWDLGLALLAAWLLYEVNYKRKGDKPLITVDYIKSNVRGWLIAISIAHMLWYCFEYMNGLYEIHHSYASRRILVWFFLTLICTYAKKELLNIFNLIWLVVGAPIAYFYAQPYIGTGEPELVGILNAHIIYIGGFILINIVSSAIRVIRKQVKLPKVRWAYAVTFAILLAGMCILANTRWWPSYLTFILVVLLLRMAVWEDRDRLLEYLCNGVLINFLFMMTFSLLHRPYYGYRLHRYSLSYQTVTMTATHLSLCLAAAGIKLYIEYKEHDDKRESLPYLVLFGVIANYQLFTLSRTGYASVIVMLVVSLLIIVFVREEKGKKLYSFFLYILAMIGSMVVCFASTSTITRLIPPLVDDPVIYDYEPCIVTGYKGTAPDYEYYMDLPRFIDVFMSKVFGIGDSTANAKDTINLEPYVGYRDNIIQVASLGDQFIPILLTDDEALEDEDNDITNGRIDIYRSYIEQLNLWGHDEMGAILQDGEEATHAHNIILQFMYDHGIIFGFFFVFFLIYTSVVCLVDYIKRPNERYELFRDVMLIGFIVAGMVEWIFHPCNPFGLCVLLSFCSLFFKYQDTFDCK